MVKKRQFSEEFKREAVKLVLEGGLSNRQAARDLGVGESSLNKWLSEYRKSTPDPLTISEKEELKQLRKENQQLKLEREILKKATAYFAKNQL